MMEKMLMVSTMGCLENNLVMTVNRMVMKASNWET